MHNDETQRFLKCVLDCYLSVRFTSCLAGLFAVKPVVSATTCMLHYFFLTPYAHSVSYRQHINKNVYKINIANRTVKVKNIEIKHHTEISWKMTACSNICFLSNLTSV